jgi:hypothetical protein
MPKFEIRELQGRREDPSGSEASRGSMEASGLHCLSGVPLSPKSEAFLAAELREMSGHPVWRARKRAEARELLALAQIAPPGRMSVEALSLSEHLRALILLRVPVPCRPEPDGPLQVAPYAVLALTYPPEALFQALPGFAFIQIHSPVRVWLANVADDPIQPLCLGAQLPPGIRVAELVLMAYGALSMQTVMVDEVDPAGVLNVHAARWWQQNLHRVPLSNVPFLGREPLEHEEVRP